MTPITGLEVEASIPPVRHELNWISNGYAICLNRLDARHPIIQRLLHNAWRYGVICPASLHPASQRAHNSPWRKTKPTTQFKRLVAHTSPFMKRGWPFRAPPWKWSDLDDHLRRQWVQSSKPPGLTKETATSLHIERLDTIMCDLYAVVVYTMARKSSWWEVHSPMASEQLPTVAAANFGSDLAAKDSQQKSLSFRGTP